MRRTFLYALLALAACAAWASSGRADWLVRAPFVTVRGGPGVSVQAPFVDIQVGGSVPVAPLPAPMVPVPPPPRPPAPRTRRPPAPARANSLVEAGC